MSFLSRRRNLILLFAFQGVIFYLFSKIDVVISLFEQFFEWQKNVHVSLFMGVNFSLGDVGYLILGGYILFLIIRVFRSKKSILFQIQMLILLNVFYFVYQVFWGMYYFQPPIAEKLSPKELNTKRLKQLALKYLDLSKIERSKVGEDARGVFNISDISQVKKEIIRIQEHLPKDIITKKPLLYQNIKPSLWAKYANFSGILGYYNPFTAEAQYHAELPPTYIPFTIAHEVGHQMGYAREQEANFLGYLVGINAQNSDLKYSTYYFVLKSVLNALRDTEPIFVARVLEDYSEPMKRDRAFEKAYREENEGIIDEVLYFTNDIFLKSNRQEGSITYSYFLQLLNQYEEG